jgi:hypothetical protein
MSEKSTSFVTQMQVLFLEITNKERQARAFDTQQLKP